MNSITFQAPEYQGDGTFQVVEFQYKGSESSGWELTRNGKPFQALGPGYVLVKTLHCGICSTDLARRFLPYPLPQIIGHEVVGLYKDQVVVAEINASHLARGLESKQCPACSHGMDTHCPDRITFGIDRLPGGFAPWFLSPQNALKQVPSSVPVTVAALTEPLAAALQAIKRTPPQNGDTVAVLGPRRLGSLVLCALQDYRRTSGKEFSISALVRHSSLESLCRGMGADQVVDISRPGIQSLKHGFDIVYDTSGSAEGFIKALDLTKRVVHLKSTNGQEILGINYLTELVVDEIGLLPFDIRHLSFSWLGSVEQKSVGSVFAMPSISKRILDLVKAEIPAVKIYQPSEKEMLAESGVQYDLALVSEISEVDLVVRPDNQRAFSLVRPRGNILVTGENISTENLLQSALIDRGIEVHTSRCGDFTGAMQILEQNKDLRINLQRQFITHHFTLNSLAHAFQVASNSRESIKVMIDIES